MTHCIRGIAVSAMVLVLSGLAFAQDHKGANTQPSEPEKNVSAIQAFNTAAQLAAWARQNNDPIELAAAARLLAMNCRAMPADSNHLKSPGDRNELHIVEETAAFTPAALLKEARELAKGNTDSLAAIDAIEKTIAIARGHPGGAFVDHDVLLPDNGTMTYTITFAGNQPMELSVYSNGPAAIDWHVYDENGNEVRSQSSEHFRSTPKWSGPFKVKLTNKTKGYIPYTVATN